MRLLKKLPTKLKAKETLESKAHKHKKNNVSQNSSNDSTTWGSLEHDKRFAKQELAKAVTPEEIDAANKKIADLDNERRDAKVELKELEEQLAQNLDATNEDVRSQPTNH